MGTYGVPVAVLTAVAALLAMVLVNMATGAQPDYADLVPAPDSIVWRVGDEPTLWLSTNRHAVDMRVSSIDLGIGELDLRDPASGEVSVLGEGLGCLDAVVSGVDVDNISGGNATITATLDRKTTEALAVYFRRTRLGTSASPNESTATTTTTSVTKTYSSLVEEAKFLVEVSVNAHFPVAITRSVTFTAGDANSGTSDYGGREVHMLEGTGVGVKACDEHEDVVISLHGDDGEELNRYLVDILAALAVNRAPDFTDGAYTIRRVCVDDATDRGTYLSGSEQVGSAVTATDADGDTVSYALGGEDPDDYYLFFEVASSGQVTVNDGGANDDSGLDSDQVYPIVLTAIDGNGGQDRITVAVQLDTATVSTAGDGSCP